MGILDLHPLAGVLANTPLILVRDIRFPIVDRIADIGFIFQNAFDLGDGPGVTLTFRLILEDVGECAVSLEVQP